MDYEPRRLTPHRRQHWGVEPDPDLEPPFDDDAPIHDPGDRRRVLWRDSATILIGVILALLVGQFLLPRATGPVAGDPSDFPSGVAIGATFAPRTLAPGETFGPIIDPSLGIDATPTPIPVITLGPTQKPKPSPSPTAEPTASPSPTPRITPRPTKTPRPTPRPTVAPTPVVTPPPPPPPTVAMSCQTQLASQTITCSSTSTNIEADSQVWDMGGSGIVVNGGNTFASIEWTYDVPGTYTVRLTVTGDDGSTTFDEDTVTVPGL